MSPAELDAVLNGLKVHIYKRPADGSLYASTHDYERFGATPLKTIRVPLAEIGDGWNVDKCPIVAKALDKARK